MAWAARIDQPLEMAPDNAIGPSNHSRSSCTMAKGERRPAWPPAPAATGIRPSAPFSTALWAKALVITSCSTTPPQPCTAALTSSRAPREVITTGTLYLAQRATSSSRRLLVLWTIWFTAKGAAGISGWARSQAASSSVIRASHSSSCEIGRAFSDGNEPTMPALHWAITRSGPETMNRGEPMAGRRRRSRRTGGRAMGCSR